MNFMKRLLWEQREEVIKSSLGYICAACNQSAYYFKTKNGQVDSGKQCLICSAYKSSGILIEDFEFTLRGHLPDHYSLVDDSTEDAVSLQDVLKRFTYDNERVLDRLSILLCQPEDNYFQRFGLYKSRVDKAHIERCKEDAIRQWHDFAHELKHVRRFTHTKAVSFYENLIGSCFRQVEEKKEIFDSALTILSRGERLFRGRLVRDNAQKEVLLAAPEKELAAPPDYLATNSRMSPPGISFLYSAGDYETALAELHPFVNDTIATGQFVATRELHFFDFTLLDNITHADANILDNPNKHITFMNRYMLEALHGLISRPYRASDTSYIETQVFAEVIRTFRDGIYDGIIFGSSQRPGGLNYVLFGDRPKSGDPDDKSKDYHVAFDHETGVTFYRITGMTAEAEKLQPSSLDEMITLAPLMNTNAVIKKEQNG